MQVVDQRPAQFAATSRAPSPAGSPRARPARTRRRRPADSAAPSRARCCRASRRRCRRCRRRGPERAADSCGHAQSTLTLAALMTRSHLGTSASISARNCSGVEPPTRKPWLPKNSRMSGDFERLDHFGVQPHEHVARQCGRREQALPGSRLEALQAGHAALGDGGHLGQHGVAAHRGDGDRPHLAGADLRQQHQEVAEHGLQAAAQQVVAAPGRCPCRARASGCAPVARLNISPVRCIEVPLPGVP